MRVWPSYVSMTVVHSGVVVQGVARDRASCGLLVLGGAGAGRDGPDADWHYQPAPDSLARCPSRAGSPAGTRTPWQLARPAVGADHQPGGGRRRRPVGQREAGRARWDLRSGVTAGCPLALPAQNAGPARGSGPVRTRHSGSDTKISRLREVACQAARLRLSDKDRGTLHDRPQTSSRPLRRERNQRAGKSGEADQDQERQNGDHYDHRFPGR